MISRRLFLASGLAPLVRASDSYSFAVFGLLHPTRLTVTAVGTARLHTDGRTIEGQQALELEAAKTPIEVTGANGAAVWFVLDAPGVLKRRYFGTLRVTAEGEVLHPVVTMGREVAVGSIVGAELPAQNTPLQALAAQAVAVRSFLYAEAEARRHDEAQFCDTTHCQFLRSPASERSRVARGVQATSGLVLGVGERAIAAHYSAACGGHTDSKRLDHYQYRGVPCEPCRRGHMKRRGHGLGLCQTGAMGLAKDGWTFRKILEHYYPGAALRSV